MADIQQAFKYCRPLAEAGDGEAQYYFASVHMFRTISQPPACCLRCLILATIFTGRSAAIKATPA